MLPIGNRFTVFLLQYKGLKVRRRNPRKNFCNFQEKFLCVSCYFANFMTGVPGLEDLGNTIAHP